MAVLILFSAFVVLIIMFIFDVFSKTFEKLNSVFSTGKITFNPFAETITLRLSSFFIRVTVNGFTVLDGNNSKA